MGGAADILERVGAQLMRANVEILMKRRDQNDIEAIFENASAVLRNAAEQCLGTTKVVCEALETVPSNATRDHPYLIGDFLAKVAVIETDAARDLLDTLVLPPDEAERQRQAIARSFRAQLELIAGRFLLRLQA